MHPIVFEYPQEVRRRTINTRLDKIMIHPATCYDPMGSISYNYPFMFLMTPMGSKRVVELR